MSSALTQSGPQAAERPDAVEKADTLKAQKLLHCYGGGAGL